MNGGKKNFLSSLIFIIFIVVGCSGYEENSPERLFGDNAYYFQGLLSLKAYDETTAAKYFRQGIKKSDTFFARKCSEKLSTLGTVSERITNALKYYRTYEDEKALLRAVEELSAGEEYDQIITLTDKLPEEAPAALFRLRFTALSKKRITAFAGEVEDWFLYKPITAEHRLYYENFSDSFLPLLLSPETIQYIQMRLYVYRYDYLNAFKVYTTLASEQENTALWLSQQTPQILSDIGKIFLYGSTNFVENARLCNDAARFSEQDGNTAALFYLEFYTGRLYDKGTGTNTDTALEHFQRAMGAASTPAQYDNALWYYFSTALKISLKTAENALTVYASSIQDPSYYSDFFDTLCLRIFAVQDWSTLYNVYTIIRPYADSETISRYAYLCGRIIDNGWYKPARMSTGLVRSLYEAAYQPGGVLYYRLLAAARLDIPAEELESALFQVPVTADFAADPNIELLLAGYIAFNLPEEIYPEWQKNVTAISLKSETAAAEFLSRQEEITYKVQAMRIASNSIFHADEQPETELYQTAYSRIYLPEISKICGEYNISEYIFLGLIRSESFFDPVITSHAGAIGLAQLMAPTAADVARKLGITEYDLNDAATNLRFGAFYLAELAGRLDGNILDALFAYNGGITRVRTWKKSAENLSADLFLEIIPFAETREYGRKVVSAAAMYGMLYYNLSPVSVVQEIMDL